MLPASQKNIVYGSITAGGDVHIGDKIYLIERDFPHCLLFLRIEKSTDGYEAMLSVKGPDDVSVPLLHQQVKLPIAAGLFEQVEDLQTLRRGSSQNLRHKGLHRPTALGLESTLPDAIYQSFFAGDIGEVCNDFMRLLQSGKIRDLLLIISTEEEPIQNLPWEMVLTLLTLGDAGLPKDNFGLVRTREKTLAGFNRQGPTTETAPIKLLFIPALPENLSERSKMLEIEEEQRKIIEAVSKLEATGHSQPKLVMEILDCANLDEINEALEKRSHDIVHISGHGAYVEAVKTGMLYLEDENGNERETPGYQLGNALRSFSSIKLLVLSACETAVGGSEGSTAEQMAAVGLPAVLAMRFSVTDQAARLFTEKLYERLAYGDSLTKAMHDARQVLWDDMQQQRANAPNAAQPAEWFTPVLYQNQVIGPLVKPGPYNTETYNRFYPKPDFLKGRHTRLVGSGFIGRKRLLIRLRQCFAQHQAVCLHGLGGLGKTTTAEAFAELYRKRNGHSIEIFRNGPHIQEAVMLKRLFEKWKSRTQPASYQADSLLAQLEDPQTNPTDKLQLLLDNCLSGPENRTILIFDNFEDVQRADDGAPGQAIASESLREFLGYLLDNAPNSCQILFTSRYRITDFNEQLTHLPIDKMSFAEQYRYLNYSDTLRKLPVAEREIIDRRINGHPRALEFLEGLLRKDRLFNLSNFDAQLGKVEARIVENLLLAQLLTRLSESERKIFLTASVFFTRTPLAVLASLLETDVDSLTDLLTALHNWSLCFYDEATQMVEVHALTRTWLRTQQLPDPNGFKVLSHRTGDYFWSQGSKQDVVLAMTYFEQAESWDNYAESAIRLAQHYQKIGLYSIAFILNKSILDKNTSLKYHIIALNGLGLHGINIGEYQTALIYLQQGLEKSYEINDPKAVSETLVNISHIFYARGNFETALDYLKQCLKIQQETGDRNGEGTTLTNIGQVYTERGDFGTALEYLQQSLPIQQENGNRKGEGSTLNNIGLIYRERGNYQMALAYFQKGLQIYKETGYRNGEGTALNNISLVYQALGDFETALSYLQKSLRIRQETGYRRGEIVTLNNISQIYKARGEYQTAMDYLEQSLRISQEIGDRIGEGNSLNNIGQIYQAQGDDQRALGYLGQSLHIQQEIGDRSGFATTSHNIGIIYLKGVQDVEQDVEQAIALFLSAYQVFTQLSSPNANVSAQYLSAIIEQIGEARFQQIIQSIQNQS